MAGAGLPSGWGQKHAPSGIDHSHDASSTTEFFFRNESFFEKLHNFNNLIGLLRQQY
jgi:hypothetical protein